MNTEHLYYWRALKGNRIEHVRYHGTGPCALAVQLEGYTGDEQLYRRCADDFDLQREEFLACICAICNQPLFPRKG